MNVIWALLGIGLLAALFMTIARMGRAVGDRNLVRVQPQRRPEPGAEYHQEKVTTATRDLGANINPSQTGNEADLWPDRTGPRTRRELGARDATDVSFVGDRVEHKDNRQGAGAQGPGAQNAPAQGAQPPARDINAMGDPQSDPTAPAVQPGIRRHEHPSRHEHGPGTNAAADLAPEDAFGEDRPAARTHAPDAQPTQWHPEDHGVPGDHIRDGHHRSASAPETRSDATDPYAHAPVPGPNHIPPEGGVDFPPEVRP
jgi:hypothetical protein